MAREEGQASLEWTGVVLLVALALGALAAVVPAVDGRSFGGFLTHRIVCAVRGGCDDGERELAAAYGDSDAELVRAHAPGIVYEPGTLTLPVDFRTCRSHDCSDAPDDPALDVHRSSRGGAPATAFTHLVRRDGETFIQYWLYYPDSTTTGANAAGGWRAFWRLQQVDSNPEYPGFHLDDWESYMVRISEAGDVRVRASSHHDYQWCKHKRCRNRWGPSTGWTRVSWGSHAGHIPTRETPHMRGRRPRLVPVWPGNGLEERSSTAEALRLIPLESIDPASYVPRGSPTPPWEKEVYRDPTSDSTG